MKDKGKKCLLNKLKLEVLNPSGLLWGRFVFLKCINSEAFCYITLTDNRGFLLTVALPPRLITSGLRQSETNSAVKKKNSLGLRSSTLYSLLDRRS